MDARRRTLARAAAGTVLLGAAFSCAAQDYPAKPILMVMPLQAASAVDVMMRIVAQKMGDNMGRQIVVENQPGAAGMIGAERVKRAAPDGYTIGALNDSILTMIPNIRQVPYDPVKDFVPVSVVAGITWVMVANNDLSAKTVPEFIALAKSRPGRIDYSSGGVGSPQHVAMEAFKAATGIYVVHIPYRGATQAALDVMSNQVQVHFGAVSIVQPHIKSGKMRALAVPSPKPLAAAARRADHGRSRGARLRMAHVGVDRRPGGDAEADRRPPERRGGEGGERPRRAREADRAGARADRLAAEQVTQWTQAGLARMSEYHQARRHQGRVRERMNARQDPAAVKPRSSTAPPRASATSC